MEINKISTMGSCSSRNIFASNINKNYKKFFSIHESIEGVTLISLMSKPVQFDKKLINSPHKYDNECVINDLTKKFLNYLKDASIDYLVLDTYFDALFDIIHIGKNKYISDSYRIQHTEYYKLLTDKKRIEIYNNFEKFYKLFTKSCDEFFEFINTKCNGFGVVLNCSRSVENYIDKSGNVINDGGYKKEFEKEIQSNAIRDILDKYILENYDVEVMPFDNTTLAYKEHVFELHPTHYEPRYYTEKTKQLIEIIERNNSLDYNNWINQNFRKLQRENAILNFNRKIENEVNSDPKNKVITNKIKSSLQGYNTARLDIKNKGNENNNIIIQNISDPNHMHQYPSWFKNNTGSGLTIHSQSNFLKIYLKCVNEGELEIALRGIDARTVDKRLPIYINYTKFFVDNNKIFDETKLVWHDEPFIYKTNVKHGQIIELYLEWMPFSCEIS